MEDKVKELERLLNELDLYRISLKLSYGEMQEYFQKLKDGIEFIQDKDFMRSLPEELRVHAKEYYNF